jgi:hypothetical protein
MATMMMTPPIEGTPTLFTPKGSMETSRCVSMMLRRCSILMKYSPKMVEMVKAKMMASNALNDM